MLEGIYDWFLDNLPPMKLYPFHIELEESLSGCNRICKWLAFEIGLEHSTATKLKWIK